MTTIVSSSYAEGPEQVDGRRYVTERHVTDDGQVITDEYLADVTIDRDYVMTQRATRYNAAFAARAAADGIAAQGSAPLTKLQFRQRFTPTERAAIDAFNASFESSGALTAEQKATIRVVLEDYKVAENILLTDNGTILGVQMYEALGLIAAGRAAEVLAQ